MPSDSTELSHTPVRPYSQTATVSRRRLLGRMLALGLASPAVASLLAACGGETAPPAPSTTSAAKPASSSASSASSSAATSSAAASATSASSSAASPAPAPQPFSVGAGSGGEVIFLGPSGSYEPLFKEKVLPPFAQKTGIKITYVPGSAIQTLAKLQASKNTGEADVAYLDDGVFHQSQKLDLVQPNDPAIVTTESELYPISRDPKHYGVSIGFLAVSILYDRAELEKEKLDPPRSWMDLGDKKYKNKSSIASINNSNGLSALIQFAKVNGGNEKNMDPGFKAIREKILPNIFTVTKSFDITSQLQQKVIWLGIWNQAGGNQMAAKGMTVSIAYPDDGVPFYQSHVVASKTAKNKKQAMELINYLGSADAQKLITEFTFYGPANSKVQLSDEVAKKVPYGEAAVKKLVPIEWETVIEKRPEWTERWMKEIEVK